MKKPHMYQLHNCTIVTLPSYLQTNIDEIVTLHIIITDKGEWYPFHVYDNYTTNYKGEIVGHSMIDLFHRIHTVTNPDYNAEYEF